MYKAMNEGALGFRLVLAALASGCLLGLVHVVSVVGLQIPFDPNEGWNAYFTQMAMTTGSPYPRDGGLLVNNYPPLSFYAIAGLTRIVGDAIIAGRIVSLLALCVVAYGIGKAAWRMGCTKQQAMFAALLFVACLLLNSDYVGMDDPQLLGHAIAIGGLIVALQEPRTPRSMVIAALMFTIAFFVKHNLILMPLSLTAWLVPADRRHALTFIASGAIFLLMGLGIFEQTFGSSLFHQVASARIYTFENVRFAIHNWLPSAVLPICGALFLCRVGRRDRFAILACIYTAVATVGGLLFSGGCGIDANAMFDADIALALCAGLLLNHLESEPWGPLVAILYVTPLVILIGDVDGDWRSADYWLHPMAEERHVASSDIALLHSNHDPALCEMLSLCYWAGKTPQVDVFNLDQRFRTGAQTNRDLLRLIGNRRFTVIELETLKPFPFAPDVQRELLRNYKIVRTDGERVFFAPR